MVALKLTLLYFWRERKTLPELNYKVFFLASRGNLLNIFDITCFVRIPQLLAIIKGLAFALYISAPDGAVIINKMHCVLECCWTLITAKFEKVLHLEFGCANLQQIHPELEKLLSFVVHGHITFSHKVPIQKKNDLTENLLLQIVLVKLIDICRHLNGNYSFNHTGHGSVYHLLMAYLLALNTCRYFFSNIPLLANFVFLPDIRMMKVIMLSM